MERKMRRFKQQLPVSEAKEILLTATNGILSLTDTDGTPYGVPLSFAYDGANAIYFHCARTGHKIDCISNDARTSFCVVAADNVVPEKFTSLFKSVIVSGKISIVTDKDEIMKGLIMLSEKYSPGIDPSDEISKFFNNVLVLRLDISAISGKEGIELTRQRSIK
ncbi:MAG: pyridoxamine 5'-phosphate oxidase family protein [Duncaniella sp.]|nr:pyridoxamine 5'-phosphate oxidase family protein [Duncaniella sp.]